MKIFPRAPHPEKIPIHQYWGYLLIGKTMEILSDLESISHKQWIC